MAQSEPSHGVLGAGGCGTDTAPGEAVDSPLEHGMRNSRAVCGEWYHITRA